MYILLSIVILICVALIAIKVCKKADNDIKFSNLNDAVEKLRADNKSEKSSIDDMASLAQTWDKLGIRAKAMGLIRQECITDNTKPILLLEWASGFMDYHAIALTPKFILYILNDTKRGEINVQIEKKLPISPEHFSQLQKMVTDIMFQDGNSSWGGSDIPAYFFTFWRDDNIINTIAIYGLGCTVNDIHSNRPPTINKSFYDATYKIAVLFQTLVDMENKEASQANISQ